MTKNADLLFVSDCPNLDLARRRLNEAAARAGVELVVREQLVIDAEAAEELGMHGSPTILVDGRDVAGTRASEAAVSCRLYATPSGLEGAPSVDDLVAALGG